jgi:hypothetical protein
MKILILEASGHMRFSWKSEHAISHFLQPLHFESSLAIQIGSFFVGKLKALLNVVNFSFDVCSPFKCVADCDKPLNDNL